MNPRTTDRYAIRMRMVQPSVDALSGFANAKLEATAGKVQRFVSKRLPGWMFVHFCANKPDEDGWVMKACAVRGKPLASLFLARRGPEYQFALEFRRIFNVRVFHQLAEMQGIRDRKWVLKQWIVSLLRGPR